MVHLRDIAASHFTAALGGTGGSYGASRQNTMFPGYVCDSLHLGAPKQWQREI